ncbi:fumarylacetoacetate hydrolase family protein [Sphaerisporangium sp. NPDC051011]|uniref:fumarylacetoacetate hydrolase family protein n=1 Tax=Sphaerisporangium sp. NPDC051011 TaxID=3155792 RepID=UPI0033F36D21
MTRLARAKMFDGTVRFGLVEDEAFLPLDRHVFGEEPGRTGQAVPLSDVRLLSPTEPRNILVMWRAFYKEGDRRTVDHSPYLAVKAAGDPPGGDGSQILIPELVGGPLAAEAELAVVIGRRAKNLTPEQAWGTIAGFTVMNDVTAPSLLHPTGQWPEELPRLVSGAVVAKCFDTFSPFGPWIETSLTDDEIKAGVTIRTLVNGEEKMRGTTADFKFTVGEVVSHASRILTLTPGDVITLGTPGVVLVDDGDVVECEVEGIGSLRNTIVAQP